MFSTKEFIDASRAFVCIRTETYENKEAEERVRSLLNGRDANTAFCMFDPQGKRRLSRAGRSPLQVIGRRSNDTNEAVVAEMKRVASRYQPKGEEGDAVLQDYLTFRQALNVASADQRLLIFVDADEAAVQQLTPTLKKLFADDDVVGRFHLDFVGEKDGEWAKSIDGVESKPAINVIQSGKFGMDGTIMSQLPLEASLDQLKTTLLADNKKFSSTEKRKVYANHVREGNRKGVKFETEIPYGEDLDGDGEIDRRRGGNNRRGGGTGRGGGRGRGQ